ncbi:MAG TPA: GtrA family protein [Armatimonadota bacterium]|nr:GtrA family protein [Armatimonadota bacterium]
MLQYNGMNREHHFITKLRTAFLASPHSLLHQVPRAFIVSVIALGFDFFSLIFFVELLHWSHLWAATASYMLGNFVQYALCSLWVFPVAPKNKIVGLIAFTALAAGGLGITDGTMWLCQKYFGMHYIPAKVIAIGLSFCWNFCSRKYLLFNDQTKTPVQDNTSVELAMQKSSVAE